MKGIIQIAGIQDLDEAEMLLSEGVDWLGFPFHLPIHEEDLTFLQAAEIVARTDPAACVLITYLDKAKAVLQATRDLRIGKVQLHGNVNRDELLRIKQEDPPLFVVKSIIIGKKSVAELEREVLDLQDVADAFLTDTFDPSTGASGGTGKTHDWTVSRELVRLSRKPVILAGGLNAQNVREAILTVQPAGVDAHTGVEDDFGKKNRAAVKAFVAEARAAFSHL